MRISELIQWIEDEIPHIPHPTVQRTLKRVAKEFFTYTYTWIHEEAYEAGCESDELLVDIPNDTHIVRVELIKVGDQVYDLTSPDGQDVFQRAAYTYQIDNEHVRVRPAPPSGMGVQLRFALAPSLSAVELPSHLLDLYGDALVEGALARLKMRAGDNSYQQHEYTYREHKERCRNRGRHEQTRKHLTSSYGGY